MLAHNFLTQAALKADQYDVSAASGKIILVKKEIYKWMMCISVAYIQALIFCTTVTKTSLDHRLIIF